MDNFKVLESVSKLAFESERISSQLENFDRSRKERIKSQDFDISPWYGVYDILQSTQIDDAQQGCRKEQAEKQTQLNILPKTDTEASCQEISSARRNKYYKIPSPMSKKENKKSNERVIFHHTLNEQKKLKCEEISEEYPSMLNTPDSMSTDHSSSPTKTKFEFELRRRSHISLTQKVFEVPRIISFTDLNSYHQRLPALHTQPLKYQENPDFLKILSSGEAKIHRSSTKPKLLPTQLSKTPLKTPSTKLLSEKNKFLSKQNIVLNLQNPKTTLPTVKTKFLKP